MSLNVKQLQTPETPAKPAQAAEYFGITRQTLWRWSKEDGFPQPLKRGRVVRYNIAAIQAWLNGEVA